VLLSIVLISISIFTVQHIYSQRNVHAADALVTCPLWEKGEFGADYSGLVQYFDATSNSNKSVVKAQLSLDFSNGNKFNAVSDADGKFTFPHLTFDTKKAIAKLVITRQGMSRYEETVLVSDGENQVHGPTGIRASIMMDSSPKAITAYAGRCSSSSCLNADLRQYIGFTTQLIDIDTNTVLRTGKITKKSLSFGWSNEAVMTTVDYITGHRFLVEYTSPDGKEKYVSQSFRGNAGYSNGENQDLLNANFDIGPNFVVMGTVTVKGTNYRLPGAEVTLTQDGKIHKSDNTYVGNGLADFAGNYSFSGTNNNSTIHTGKATLTVKYYNNYKYTKEITIVAGRNLFDVYLQAPLICGHVNLTSTDLPLPGIDINFTQGSATKTIFDENVKTGADGVYHLNYQWISSNFGFQWQYPGYMPANTNYSYYSVDLRKNIQICNYQPDQRDPNSTCRFNTSYDVSKKLLQPTQVNYKLNPDKNVSPAYDLVRADSGRINYSLSGGTTVLNTTNLGKNDIKAEQKEPNKITGKLYIDPQTNQNDLIGYDVRVYRRKFGNSEWEAETRIIELINNIDGNFEISNEYRDDKTKLVPGYFYHVYATYHDDDSGYVSDFSDEFSFSDNYDQTKEITLPLTVEDTPIQKYNVDLIVLLQTVKDAEGIVIPIKNDTFTLYRVVENLSGTDQITKIRDYISDDKGHIILDKLVELPAGSFYFVVYAGGNNYYPEKMKVEPLYLYTKSNWRGENDIKIGRIYRESLESQHKPQGLLANLFWIGRNEYLNDNQVLLENVSNLIEEQYALLTKTYQKRYPELPSQVKILQSYTSNAHAVSCIEPVIQIDPQVKQYEIVAESSFIDYLVYRNALLEIKDVFTHEFGHTVLMKNKGQNKYCTVNLQPNKITQYWKNAWSLCGKYDNKDCFGKLKDSSFMRDPDASGGHPRDNYDELFASVFHAVNMYPDEYKRRVNNTTDPFLKKMLTTIGKKVL
jgi:hypothetical protein